MIEAELSYFALKLGTSPMRLKLEGEWTSRKTTPVMEQLLVSLPDIIRRKAALVPMSLIRATSICHSLVNHDLGPRVIGLALNHL